MTVVEWDSVATPFPALSSRKSCAFPPAVITHESLVPADLSSRMSEANVGIALPCFVPKAAATEAT